MTSALVTPHPSGGRRFDPVLWFSLCFMGGALCLENRFATALAAAVIFVVAFGHFRRGPWLFSVIVFAISAVRAESRTEAYRATWTTVRHVLGAPKRCEVEGRVVRSPTWRGDALGYTLELTRAECEGVVLPLPVLARVVGGPSDLTRGDRVEGVVQLGIQRLFRNLDLPDPTIFAARSGVVLSGGALTVSVVERGGSFASGIDAFRAHVRERISATFSPLAVGMAKALVLGENDLTDEEDDAFRQSGLAHLLAVSGTHLIFAVVSLVSALTFVLVRVPALAERTHVARWSSLVGALLALLYADFAGGSGSAWRAAWMLSAAFLVRALDRRPGAARSVAASIVVGVWLDPLAVFDISFMLSLAATTGLLTLGRHWAPLAERFQQRPLRLFAQGMIATVSSILPCSVLLAVLSPSVSLPGMVLNVLAAPFGETVALPLCLAHALLAPLPWLEQGAATVGSGALLIVRQAAFLSTEVVARVPFLGVPLVMPGAGHLAVLGVVVCAWFLLPTALLLRVRDGRWRGAWGAGVFAVLALVEFRTRSDGAPRGMLRVSALDVEQGDATLIDFPDGKVMLVDGGGYVGSPVDPGERVLLPLLRARRRAHIDVVMLSHPHPDHFGGLGAVVRTVSVGEFWDTGQGRSEGAGPVYAELMREVERRGIPIRGPAELCGTRAFGGAWLDVVGPCPEVIPNRSANDNSWVVRIRHGRRAVLLTGDAEHEQEHEILERSAGALRADLLKVGHHGSRTSTSPAFLAAVAPSVATISCGVRNRYGHPHQVTLDTLTQGGVQALRLDDLGGVEWWTDGEDIGVIAFNGLRKPLELR